MAFQAQVSQVSGHLTFATVERCLACEAVVSKETWSGKPVARAGSIVSRSKRELKVKTLYLQDPVTRRLSPQQISCASQPTGLFR
jgi:hypothetical protein